MSTDNKPKMAPHADAPPGLEQDSLGNPIPFAERTPEDKEKARANLAEKLHSDTSVKDPEEEAETPAPMPRTGQGTADTASKSVDPEGQQGSTSH